MSAAERTHSSDLARIFGEEGWQHKPFTRQAHARLTSFGQHHGRETVNVLHPQPLLKLFEFGFTRPDEEHRPVT